MRVRVLTIGSGLALMALTACGGATGSEDGGESSEGGGSSEVTMWIHPIILDDTEHKAFWDEAVATFETANPGINVNVEIKPWAKRREALTAAIAAGEAPDVTYLIPDDLAAYHGQGALVPIDGYLSDETKDRFLPAAVDAVTIDDEMVGAPVLTNVLTTLCNKKVFEQAQISEYPQSWDDMLALGAKLKPAGLYATQYGAAPDYSLNGSFYPLLWQAGGEVFDDDGGVAFNGPEGLAAIEFAKQLVDEGYVPQDVLTARPALEQTQAAQGKVACTIANVPQEMEPFWGKDNIVVQPPMQGVEQLGYGTVGSLAILNGSEDVEAVADWINFILEPETLNAYNVASDYFSPYGDVTLYEDDPVLGVVEELRELTSAGPVNENGPMVMGVLAPEIQSVLLGDKDPQQALDDAAAAVEAQLQ